MLIHLVPHTLLRKMLFVVIGAGSEVYVLLSRGLLFLFFSVGYSSRDRKRVSCNVGSLFSGLQREGEGSFCVDGRTRPDYDSGPLPEACASITDLTSVLSAGVAASLDASTAVDPDSWLPFPCSDESSLVDVGSFSLPAEAAAGPSLLSP